MLCWPIQLLPAWFSGANDIYFHLTGRQLHCHSQPCLPCLVIHSSCQTLLLLFSRIISLERVPTYVASHQPEFHKGLLSLLATCPIFREVPPSLPVPPVCLASRLFRVVQPLITPTGIVTASCLIILQSIFESCRPPARLPDRLHLCVSRASSPFGPATWLLSRSALFICCDPRLSLWGLKLCFCPAPRPYVSGVCIWVFVLHSCYPACTSSDSCCDSVIFRAVCHAKRIYLKIITTGGYNINLYELYIVQESVSMLCTKSVQSSTWLTSATSYFVMLTFKGRWLSKHLVTSCSTVLVLISDKYRWSSSQTLCWNLTSSRCSCLPSVKPR